jgi:NitT/TauT family transport system substrate-binding protein
MPPISKYGLLAMLLLAVVSAVALWPRDDEAPRAAGAPIRVTYAVATADLNVGYPFATLPKALGYFRDEGLDVKVVPGQSSAAVIQLLLSGRADVGVAVPDPVMVQVAQANAPLVSVYPASRISGGGNVVLDSSPYHSTADLRGRRIGTPDYGSGGAIALRRSLALAGMSEKDVKLIAVGYGTPAYEALNRGEVESSSMHGAGFMRAIIAGYKFRMLPRTVEEVQRYGFNIFARVDYVEKHPEVIAAIGRATAKATVFLQANPEAAVRVFWDQYPDRAPKNRADPAALKTDLTILKAQMADMAADVNPAGFAWGSQDPAIYDRMQNGLLEFKQIAKPIAVDRFFTNRFAAAYNDFDRAKVIAQARAWPQRPPLAARTSP